MTEILSRAAALPRLVLSGGDAGDAGAARGRHIAFNVVVQLAARVLMMAMSVVTVSLTARTLDPTGYGVWNGVSSYVGLFGVLTDVGLTMAALQRMAAMPEQEAQWLAALAGTRIASSAIALALCAATVPLFLHGPDHAQLVAYIMMATNVAVGATALTTVFESRLRAGLNSSLSVLQSFIWLGAVLGLAETNGSVVAFAVADTTLLLAIGLLQLKITRRYARVAWREGLRLWKPLARAALPLGLASIANSIYWQIDSFLLLRIAGASESGIYGAAYGFLSPLIFLPAAVMTSLYPVLSAVHARDPARTRRIVQLGLDAMAVIGLPVLAGTIALSDPIIHLMYGDEFARSAGLLPILMIAFVSICYGSLAGYMAPVLGLQWRLAAYAVTGAVANVILNLVLIPRYGAHGSAWATVITELLTMTLMLSTVLRRMRMAPSPWSILRTVALAAAMVGVMDLAKPLGLLPAGTIGVLFYAAGLLVLRIVGRDQLRVLRG